MPQVAMTVRLDSNLKKEFDSLCSQFGLSSNAAFNVFARTVVQRRKIPFEIVSDEIATARQAQAAIDEYFSAHNMGMADIEAWGKEHLRTPYAHAKR